MSPPPQRPQVASQRPPIVGSPHLPAAFCAAQEKPPGAGRSSQAGRPAGRVGSGECAAPRSESVGLLRESDWRWGGPCLRPSGSAQAAIGPSTPWQAVHRQAGSSGSAQAGRQRGLLSDLPHSPAKAPARASSRPRRARRACCIIACSRGVVARGGAGGRGRVRACGGCGGGAVELGLGGCQGLVGFVGV